MNTHLNKYSKLANLLCYTALGVLLITLGACSTTMESMDSVNQNLDEGRLVPAAAVAVPDILNQYDFHYPAPQHGDAAVTIEFDRRHVYTAGDTVLAQLALTTKRPLFRPFHLHVLIYDDDHRDTDHQAFVHDFLQQLEKRLATNGMKIPLSVDSNFALPSEFKHLPSLSDKRETNFKDFLASRSLLNWGDGIHHFLLLSGKIKYLNSDQAQDVTDIGRVFAARKSKISAISYGEKPRIAVLRNLGQKGQGHVYFKNEFFDLNRVLRAEFDLVNAVKLKQIEIRIKPMAGASIEKVVSPGNTEINNGSVIFKIPDMLSGQQFVALLKLKIPAIASTPRNTFVQASLRYFNANTRKYASAQSYGKVDYSMDINQTLPLEDSKIRRARLILATQDTILNAAYAVRAGRNFKAIADITQQRDALNRYVTGKKDQQLRRDIKILDKFIANLHDFDQSWFQGIKIWKDMSLDSDRFSTDYE